eukprot:1094773-Pyramimonas_sp.AAC.1
MARAMVEKDPEWAVILPYFGWCAGVPDLAELGGIGPIPLPAERADGPPPPPAQGGGRRQGQGGAIDLDAPQPAR